MFFTRRAQSYAKEGVQFVDGDGRIKVEKGLLLWQAMVARAVVLVDTVDEKDMLRTAERCSRIAGGLRFMLGGRRLPTARLLTEPRKRKLAKCLRSSVEL